MIVLRTPKGWTGPKEVDGKKTEGYWRSHQVPLAGLADNPAHLKMLEEWMRSYRPEELFDEQGGWCRRCARWRPRAPAAWAPIPHANGGILLKDLRIPDFRDYAVDVPAPGAWTGEATRVLGAFLRDVMKLNMDQAQLPRVRPGRDGLEPAGRAVRGDRPHLGRRARCRRTITSRPTAGSWRS